MVLWYILTFGILVFFYFGNVTLGSFDYFGTLAGEKKSQTDFLQVWRDKTGKCQLVGKTESFLRKK